MTNAPRKRCSRLVIRRVRRLPVTSFTMGVPPATVQRILRHSSITVTTGTYVEVIEAVQRDALDSMGALFEQVGDESSARLSSKQSRLSSRLSSNARKSGP